MWRKERVIIMAIPAYYSLLQRGSSGPDVALVQTWLNGVRDACTWYSELKADGKFGISTENAVKEFQLKNTMKVDGKVVDTPPKELELLYHLASNPNRVYTRDQLLDEVWGFEYYGDSRTVDVHVKRLREKLEGVSDKWTLKTVWGVGYKFEVKE